MQFARKIVLLSAVVMMGAAGGAAAKENDLTNATKPVSVVTVEGMTEYRLPNGLRVVLYPDMSKPTATVNMTYLVGSRHENYGETGMAHLLEHLMFKGSKNYPNPTAEFTKRGFRMNGSTWLDRTNYHVSFTASDDNMKWALGWQADAMINSFIARKDLDTEMTVVRNEYEMGENRPTSVLLKRMQSVLFDWHSYGRSTIGARSDIENVEIENLQAFYRRYYQPDNAVLTVSGRFDTDEVLGWIAELFGPIAKPERVLPKEWTVEPAADGEREFTVRRPGETQMLMIGYRLPAALHPDWEPAAMATSILSDAPTGRLYKELVETGLATQVFGWTIPGAQPGFVVFGAQVKKGEDLGPVRAKMVDVIENSFARTPVTDQELERQKAEQATMFERQISDPEAFAVGLSDYIALGDWRVFFADRDAIAQVKTAEVDADSVPQLCELFRAFKPDIVVNVALPYQDLTIMDACLECGCNYLDTANYEPKDEAHFEYSWQWAYQDRFKAAGLTAILGCGFDPGVTAIFTAYAAKHHFDEIHYLDIVDCNAGNHGMAFATNFNPEINIREVTQKGRYYENGEWVVTEPHEIHKPLNYPGIGERESYVIYHEELESLVKNYPTIRRARFWMTFGQEYLTHLRVIQNIGMARIDPIIYNGVEIVPIQFLKAVLPDPKSLGANYHGQTSIGCRIRGVKDGKERTYYIYNNCDHEQAFKETGTQAVSFTTGVPAALGASMWAKGLWRGAGVFNVEEFDPDPFLAELGEQGLPWHELFDVNLEV